MRCCIIGKCCFLFGNGFDRVVLWRLCLAKNSFTTQIEAFHSRRRYFLGAAWLYTSLLGALPYYASGDFPLFKALFESASALTTTGVSSVLEGEPYPESLLLWHQINQWLGGIGAIIIFAVIMPQLGSSAANLFSAEVQGNSAEKRCRMCGKLCGSWCCCMWA